MNFFKRKWFVHSFCLPSAEMNLNRIRFTLVEVVKLQEETLYPILFYTIEYFFARSLIARLQSYRLYHFCCVYTILSGLSISAENGTISLSIVPLVHCWILTTFIFIFNVLTTIYLFKKNEKICKVNKT